MSRCASAAAMELSTNWLLAPPQTISTSSAATESASSTPPSALGDMMSADTPNTSSTSTAVARAVAAGATAVDVDEVLGVSADIMSPNALGGVLDADSVAALDVEIVCGGANNQLVDSSMAAALAQRDILYAPDYVV